MVTSRNIFIMKENGNVSAVVERVLDWHLAIWILVSVLPKVAMGLEQVTPPPKKSFFLVY